MSEEIEVFEGSNNIFADIGLAAPDERLAHAQMGVAVVKILHSRKLKQREMADLLGIKQSEVSHLMNGRFNCFTTDKFLNFLKRLDQKVVIQVSPRHEGESYQQVTFAP
jgi:predicted XRE-type DNA-binding protein